MKMNLRVALLVIMSCFINLVQASEQKYKVHNQLAPLEVIPTVRPAAAQPTWPTQASLPRKYHNVPRLTGRPVIIEQRNSVENVPLTNRLPIINNTPSNSPTATTNGTMINAPELDTLENIQLHDTTNNEPIARPSTQIPPTFAQLPTSRKKGIIYAAQHAQSNIIKQLKYSDPHVVEHGATSADGILRLLKRTEELYEIPFSKYSELEQKIKNTASHEQSEDRKKHLATLRSQQDAIRNEYCHEFNNRERLYARYWRARYEELKNGPVSHR